MSTRKTILAVIVAFIVSNVLTTIWYMATDEANMVPYRRAEVNYTGLIVNHLIYALLFVHLLLTYIKPQGTLVKGFVGGIILGAIMFLPQALVIRSIWAVDFNTIFVFNSLAHILIGGIMGLAVTPFFITKKQA